MDAEQIARKVAADLAPEVGGNLKSVTDKVINGTLPPPGEKTRSLSDIAEMATIAHFIVTVAIELVKLASDGQQIGAWRAMLEKLPRPLSLSRELAGKIIDAVMSHAGPPK